MTETTPPDPPVLSDGDCERLWRMLSEPSADGQLAALDRAVERMRAAEAKVLEYESAITWNTSCTSCARVLDSAYTETVRREQAEEKLAEIRGICRDIAARQPGIPVPVSAILAIIGSKEPGDG